MKKSIFILLLTAALFGAANLSANEVSISRGTHAGSILEVYGHLAKVNREMSATAMFGGAVFAASFGIGFMIDPFFVYHTPFIPPIFFGAGGAIGVMGLIVLLVKSPMEYEALQYAKAYRRAGGHRTSAALRSLEKLRDMERAMGIVTGVILALEGTIIIGLGVLFDGIFTSTAPASSSGNLSTSGSLVYNNSSSISSKPQNPKLTSLYAPPGVVLIAGGVLWALFYKGPVTQALESYHQSRRRRGRRAEIDLKVFQDTTQCGIAMCTSF